MGLIGKMIGGAIGAKVLQRLERGARSRPTATTRNGEYIPANAPVGHPAGGALLERCGRFCKENPKLVTTIGSAALAIALASLAKRRRI